MELYIDKEFLDNFYIDFQDDPVQKILKEIIVNYGSKRVFINYREDEFTRLENENEFFALISNIIPPISVSSIREHLFSNSDFEQTMVFMNREEDWFVQADKKGVLCFSFDNYREKINKIIDKLHFRIDLSERFEGWDFLLRYRTINFNSLVISDGYILADKNHQKMEDNLLPILEFFISDAEREYKIQILTKDLNQISDRTEHFKEKAKKRHRKLNSVFAKFKTEFSIIMNNVSNDFDFHDRNIITNFSLMECGKGFNLIPFKPSNSQIVSETIFDKYTYKRLNNIMMKQKDYIEKLMSLETSRFKMYP